MRDLAYFELLLPELPLLLGLLLELPLELPLLLGLVVLPPLAPLPLLLGLVVLPLVPPVAPLELELDLK